MALVLVFLHIPRWQAWKKSRFPAIGIHCCHLGMWECLQSKCRFAFLPEYECFAHMHEKQEGCERDQGFPQLAVWHHPATHAGRQPVGLGAETNGRAGGWYALRANNCDAETSRDAERVNQLSFSSATLSKRRITNSERGKSVMKPLQCWPVNHTSEHTNWKWVWLISYHNSYASIQILWKVW